MPGLAAAAAALGVLAVAGCGGSERQDANEPSGIFPMRVVSATFPRHQRLSQEAIMRIVVANTCGSCGTPPTSVRTSAGS